VFPTSVDNFELLSIVPFYIVYLLALTMRSSNKIENFGRMFSSGVEKLKESATNVINRDTPLEKQLKDATSNQKWGCATSVLAEIARASMDYNDYFLIMKTIWDGTSDKPARWRRVLKSLALLEYLIKNGTERVIDETREKLYQIRSLADFHYTEDGVDKGGAIRTSSKQICELVNDVDLLKAERQKARQNRDKFVGIGAHGERTGAGYTYKTNFDAAAEPNRRGGDNLYSSGGRYDPYPGDGLKKVSSNRTSTNKLSSVEPGTSIREDRTAAHRELHIEKLADRARAEKERDKARKQRERAKEKTRIDVQKKNESSNPKGSQDASDSGSESSASSSSESSESSEEPTKQGRGTAKPVPVKTASLLEFDTAPNKTPKDEFFADAAWGSFESAAPKKDTFGGNFDPFANFNPVRPIPAQQYPQHPQYGRTQFSNQAQYGNQYSASTPMPDFFAQSFQPTQPAYPSNVSSFGQQSSFNDGFQPFQSNNPFQTAPNRNSRRV